MLLRHENIPSSDRLAAVETYCPVVSRIIYDIKYIYTYTRVRPLSLSARFVVRPLLLQAGRSPNTTIMLPASRSAANKINIQTITARARVYACVSSDRKGFLPSPLCRCRRRHHRYHPVPPFHSHGGPKPFSGFRKLSIIQRVRANKYITSCYSTLGRRRYHRRSFVSGMYFPSEEI